MKLSLLSVCTLSIFLGSAASLFAQDAQPSVSTVDRTAFSLAIQRFDVDQSKPLNLQSPEFKWMQTFLKAATAKSPDLANLMTGRPQNFLEDPYQSMSIQTQADATAESSLFTKYVKDWVQKATPGCLSKSVSQDTVSGVTYGLDASCVSPTAQGLIAAGISRITLVTQKDSRGEELGDTLILSAPAGTMELMRPVASLLSAVPETDLIAKAFVDSVPGASRGGMIGEASFEITMDGQSNQQHATSFPESRSNKPGSMDAPITLTIKKGWGDCMAGCISKHYWTIVGTPKKTLTGYDFDVQLTESGSPVPKNPDQY